MLIWIVLAGLSSVTVVAVAAWARGERRKAETETAARQERARLQMEEARLLAKLKGEEKGDGQ